ncbi:PTS sugar transporter subunit IIB [Oenococcus sp. UCMA 17063]|nr:PTS sugar transporter subunit IIB [Oenococcus sp. UCMA 17063]
MADKTIMLVCASGMSTSLLVSKMNAAAKTSGKNYDIFATASSDVDAKIKEKSPDVLLLGPQIKYMEADMKKRANAIGIPVEVINMQDYGMMNGTNVLTEAEKLMGV